MDFLPNTSIFVVAGLLAACVWTLRFLLRAPASKDRLSKYVECKDGTWGFWDETQTEWIGGYRTQKAACDGMRAYAETL